MVGASQRNASENNAMNAVTVNTFPSMNALTSARGWFLALIVLLHLGFFWALSNGLSIGGLMQFAPPLEATFPKAEPRELPPPREIDDAPIVGVTVPAVDHMPNVEYDESSNRPEITRPPLDAARSGDSVGPPAAASMIEPAIDPRIGLTQPLYPAQAIRGNQTGTVLLSVLVLENGRVGEVRVDQSSGHPSLDESAAREARRWKLKPGMRDGVPVAMWKQIPVTFRLKDGVRM
jgi:periplasmic protein TonB